MAIPAESVTVAGNADPLIIAGNSYHSRLLVGTGKYRDNDETRRAFQMFRRLASPLDGDLREVDTYDVETSIREIHGVHSGAASEVDRPAGA